MERNWFLRGVFFLSSSAFFQITFALRVPFILQPIHMRYISCTKKEKKIIRKGQLKTEYYHWNGWKCDDGGRFTIPWTQVEITISSDFNGSTSVSNWELRIYNFFRDFSLFVLLHCWKCTSRVCCWRVSISRGYFQFKLNTNHK